MGGSVGGTFRIALVGHKSLPANYGGVEVYAEEVGARLVERGHTVLSFTSSKDGGGTTYRGIERHRVGRFDGKHMGALSQALTATISACRAGADVVHFMAMGPSVFSPLVRVFTNATVIVTVNGRDDQRRKWGPIARRLMRLSYHTVTRAAHGVVTVSRDLESQFANVAKGDVIYIPNAVDVRVAADVDLGALGVGDRSYVLFAGRLVPEKRIEKLIEAFRTLGDDIDLVIAGGSGGAPEYEHALHAAAVGDPRIRFLGHRTAAEVDALMRRALAFVLPSELEGLPLALLEAAARATPLVVSDLPCHREIVGEAGPGAHVVAVDDVAGFAAAISTCVTDRCAAAHDAGIRARRVRDAYDWDSVTAQTEHFYRTFRTR
jgi:glycosyltransferase involved in cell wall biosynthesis